MRQLCLALSLITLFSILRAQAQTLQILDSHPPTSIRGLSAVILSDKRGALPPVIWASGSGGTIGRSIDGGLHWTWIKVPGYEKRDFRDIHAIDTLKAVIMGVDTPAVILRTIDGGNTWDLSFKDPAPGMFLDAMDFSSIAKPFGYVIGDPVPTATGNRFYMAMTEDEGIHWTPLAAAFRPLADSGEGCFASSGTNVKLILDSPHAYAFVSGGPVSRLFLDQGVQQLPLLQGAVSTGANSIATFKYQWMVVGGDFAHDTISSGNCLYSTDAGKHWAIPHTPPHGYRSCVLHLWGQTWLCCGTSGVDVSEDNGDNWRQISKESFHVATYPGTGNTVWLAGARGRVAALQF
jgi:photosystem II stability/assembly factor-like uncharacterized protein